MIFIYIKFSSYCQPACIFKSILVHGSKQLKYPHSIWSDMSIIDHCHGNNFLWKKNRGKA